MWYFSFLFNFRYNFCKQTDGVFLRLIWVSTVCLRPTERTLGVYGLKIASLYVEADEPSLYSRREKLSLQYAIRLHENPSNPAHEVTFPPNYVDLYEQKPKAIKSFGIRISPLLESTNIKP